MQADEYEREFDPGKAHRECDKTVDPTEAAFYDKQGLDDLNRMAALVGRKRYGLGDDRRCDLIPWRYHCSVCSV